MGAERDGGGSREGSTRVEIGTHTNGKEEVPRRSPGSSSMEPENGMVGCPSGIKITVSEGGSSRGSMMTR